jgi:hypothetical protein
VTLRSVSNFISDDGTRDGAYGHSPDFQRRHLSKIRFVLGPSTFEVRRQRQTPTLILHSDNDFSRADRAG